MAAVVDMENCERKTLLFIYSKKHTAINDLSEIDGIGDNLYSIRMRTNPRYLLVGKFAHSG